MTDLSLLQETAVLLAGVAAGTINTVVGSGTLITFPTLLAFGVPPVTANVSNTLGLVPGSVSGAIGYRAHLTGQRDRILRLVLATMIGSAIGATLLLVLPSAAFRAIVPALIVVGLVLVVLGPRISAHAAAHADGTAAPDAGWVPPAVLGAGIYGGYFGAAQGVLVLGILGAGAHDSLQRQNAVKNVVVASSNALAAVIFVFSGHMDWVIVGLLAVGAAAGGQLGAHLGQRLPAPVLRVFIVVVGVTALVSFLSGSPRAASPHRTHVPTATVTERPHLSCPGGSTSSTSDHGFSGPPPPRGTLSDADALAEVARVVRHRRLDISHATFVVLARTRAHEARSYLVPDAAGEPIAQVDISTVASRGSAVPDRWIADGWTFCD